MRKTVASLAVAAALSIPALAFAQAAPAPASPHTLTGNFGFFSQYIFRGLTQTDNQPALQGGFDYAHSSGFYLGTWASNISWLSDYGAYRGSSMEWDFYGGYKGTLSGDFGYDVGLLQYYYPGSVNPGFTKADTLEGYGALSWKWLSAKLSYSLGSKTFGVADSRGTYYLDLTATYPVTDKFNVIGHYGMQKYKGNSGGNSNDSQASYNDWKVGVSYTLPRDFTVGAFFTGTSMNSTQEAFYTPLGTGTKLGDTTGTVYIQKTF
jgi:uncharacterized protein (TIGR02001 family)